MPACTPVWAISDCPDRFFLSCPSPSAALCSTLRNVSGSCQRHRAVLLLIVEEERTVRKPADKVIAPVLLDNPVHSHVDIIQKTRLLYQFYCINELRPFIFRAPLRRPAFPPASCRCACADDGLPSGPFRDCLHELRIETFLRKVKGVARKNSKYFSGRDASIAVPARCGYTAIIALPARKINHL